MRDLFDRELLSEARERWQETTVIEGGRCPCCDRWGKIYARSINRTMAASLIWLSHQDEPVGRWVDVPREAPKWLVSSNQLPTMRWWGLIERKPNETDPTKKHSGHWRVTPKGKAFSKGLRTVSRKVFTYDGEPVSFSDEWVTIEDCFEDRFDYEKTMNSHLPS